ncbi:AAA family ATPase [Jeotgalibacillus terrae]|uniref:AAA family ATPase n=1 Tax=Jeotgalibacillus terrae TaxID=587735 RepID=A0ABW5ZIQ7_9BACL|nr:AAA family ATPase [Jeotgalibacillus terrae]MBM7578615.1 deoxyadenosine/deoxycytidine kinase [Jeotgalibacillus terrae]
MKRLAIITVGKTHSGKTTFARQLEQKLTNSFVMDQDTHAEFLNTYYKKLQPKKGPNILKHALTKLIVDYAKEYTGFHFIVSNSNRAKSTRQYLLKEIYHKEAFTRILVHFDLSDDILYERVENSTRDTHIFRGPYKTFKDVLIRQEKESELPDIVDPVEGEADYLLMVKEPADVDRVIEKIVTLVEA